MPLFGRKREPEPPPVAVAEPPVTLPDPPAVNADGMRSMADHQAYLLACVEELPPFGMSLIDALGGNLDADVVAGIDLPGFDNSAMDGYAVHAEDVAAATEQAPVRLPVVGEIAAGQAPPHRLAPGSVMKIMTGAPLPAGADAIVPYELTDRGDTDVTVRGAVQVGQHVRRQGEDIASGTTVLRAGDHLGPRAIGLLAAIGQDKAVVRPQARVVVISTGSELVEPGTIIDPHQQIFDSNSYLLAAVAKTAGAQVFRVGRVADDAATLKQTINDQLIRADLIISSGGVSEGDYDVVKEVLPELGVTDFAKVAMQPGKPQGFGLIGEDKIPMITLPGNPVSAFVSFELFVRPVLRKLMGATPYVRPTVRAVAAAPMTSVPGKLQAGRVTVGHDEAGRRTASLVGGHGSHLIGTLVQADGLVLIPAEVERVEIGDEVDVLLLES